MRMLTEIQATDNVQDWRTLNAARQLDAVCAECGEREGSESWNSYRKTKRERGELTAPQCVMAAVDCTIRILKSEAADEFTKGGERCWFKHFGVPKYLKIDEAKGWSSKHVGEWCSSRGIALDIQPAEQELLKENIRWREGRLNYIKMILAVMTPRHLRRLQSMFPTPSTRCHW